MKFIPVFAKFPDFLRIPFGSHEKHMTRNIMVGERFQILRGEKRKEKIINIENGFV